MGLNMSQIFIYGKLSSLAAAEILIAEKISTLVANEIHVKIFARSRSICATCYHGNILGDVLLIFSTHSHACAAIMTVNVPNTLWLGTTDDPLQAGNKRCEVVSTWLGKTNHSAFGHIQECLVSSRFLSTVLHCQFQHHNFRQSWDHQSFDDLAHIQQYLRLGNMMENILFLFVSALNILQPSVQDLCLLLWGYVS